MIKTIYTVEITRCSLPAIYWYEKRIGLTYECEKVINTSKHWPSREVFRTLEPVGVVEIKGLHFVAGNILPRDAKVIRSREEITNSFINN